MRKRKFFKLTRKEQLFLLCMMHLHQRMVKMKKFFFFPNLEQAKRVSKMFLRPKSFLSVHPDQSHPRDNK